MAGALALYPVLAMYGWESISLGDILLLFITFNCVIQTKNNQKESFAPNRIHIIFIAYCAFVIIVQMFLGKGIIVVPVVKRFLKYSFFVVVISVSKDFIDAEKFFQYYRRLIYLVFIVLVFQYIMYYGAHTVVVPKIPFLPYIGTISVEVQTRSLSYAFRPGSFLGEPGACSYVVLPFLCYSLFPKDSAINIKDVFVATLSIMMTASSSGLICAVIIYVLFGFRILSSNDELVERKIKRILALCVVFVMAYVLFRETPLSQSFNRLISNEATGEKATAWEKTKAGSELVQGLPLIESIFGIGFGNIDMSTLNNYTNGVNYLLLCTGYIGLGIMLFWALSVFLNTNYAGKVTVIVFCALCVSCRIIISYNMMYFNIFAMLDGEVEDKLQNENKPCQSSRYIK